MISLMDFMQYVTSHLFLLQNLQSGSTCISLLVRGNKAYLAWLGDSQAVLVRDGQPVHIMNPHKPEREVSFYK